MHIRPFDEADEDAVVALWRHCGLLRPWNDPFKDIVRKLDVQRELFLVGEMDGVVVGAVGALASCRTRWWPWASGSSRTSEGAVPMA